jgi:very-short-patch-repair endonuclease
MRKLRRIKKLRTPRKRKIIGTSKIEKEFGLFLRRLGVDVEEQHQIGYRYYDFKVKGQKILIEFDGDFYHCNPEIYDKPINQMQKDAIDNDTFKDLLAASRGYIVIRVWENDYKNKKHQVIKMLKEAGLC